MNSDALQNLVIQTLVDDQKIMKEEIQSLKDLLLAHQQQASVELVAPPAEQQELADPEPNPLPDPPQECCTCQTRKRKREIVEEEEDLEVMPQSKKRKFSDMALSFLGQSVTTLLWFTAYEVFSAYDMPKL